MPFAWASRVVFTAISVQGKKMWGYPLMMAVVFTSVNVPSGDGRLRMWQKGVYEAMDTQSTGPASEHPRGRLRPGAGRLL